MRIASIYELETNLVMMQEQVKTYIRSSPQINIPVVITAENLEDVLMQAVNFHQSGRFSEAELLYRKILEADPFQPNANHNLGVLALDADEANASLDYFRAALDNNQNDPQFWVSYVDALIKAGQSNYAREVLMQGLELGLHGDEVNVLVDRLTEATAQVVSVTQSQADIEAARIPLADIKQINVKQDKSHPSDPIIHQAIALQQKGKLVEAKAKYTKLLKQYPHHPQILTGLGVIAIQTGNINEGVRILEQSLRIDAEQASALSSLSVGYCRLHRFADAIAACNHAIVINPKFVDAFVNRGIALKGANRLAEAIESYKVALAFNAKDADTHFNLAIIYKEQKQYKDAVECFRQVLALNPNDVEAHEGCGEALFELKCYEEARQSYSKAIQLKGSAVSYFGRGLSNYKLTYLQEACADFDRCIQLNSNHAKAYNNRGLVLVDMHRYEEAAADYNHAISIDPEYQSAYWNKAILSLLTGNYEQGWLLYETRWKGLLKYFKQSFPQPLWLGEQSLVGKTLFIYPEQGLGDFIQFCRYVSMLEALGAKVILEAPKALKKLVSTLKGSFEMVEAGATLPDFDYHCPIMSLPLAFKTTLNKIPAAIPYLYADNQKSQVWLKSLGKKSKPRVGLVWSGSTIHKNDRYRSIQLEQLEPLLSLPFEFHVLQKEIREHDLGVIETYPQLKVHSDALTDFSETAALIQHMDLVISVDTSVAHLAGAMGKKCWVLLPYSPDFRWLLNRSDSPWYPSLTLFRQHKPLDWTSVVNQVKARLEAIFGAVIVS